MQERELVLEYDKNALKFLEKCDDFLYRRIVKRIGFLRMNPFPSDSKFMKGRSEKVYRIRVGGYRIFYIVFYERNLLFIVDIKKRPQAYLKERSEEYEADFLIKRCACCGKDIIVKVLMDGEYFGGNYFPGKNGMEDDLSWECDLCWNG